MYKFGAVYAAGGAAPASPPLAVPPALTLRTPLPRRTFPLCRSLVMFPNTEKQRGAARIWRCDLEMRKPINGGYVSYASVNKHFNAVTVAL